MRPGPPTLASPGWRFPRAFPLRTMLDRPHQEALGRIRFCIAESLLGVITGEWASIRPSTCGPPSASWTVPPTTLHTWPIRRSAPDVGIVSESREALRQVVAEAIRDVRRSALGGNEEPDIVQVRFGVRPKRWAIQSWRRWSADRRSRRVGFTSLASSHVDSGVIGRPSSRARDSMADPTALAIAWRIKT